MRKILLILILVGFTAVSQAVLVDDYESYGTGALPDVAVPPHTTSEAAWYADIMTDPLDSDNEVISNYGSGDYRDTRQSTPIAITTLGTLTFDVLVNVETGLDNAFGLTHNEGMSWYSDYGPYVRVTTNAGGDSDGLIGLDTSDSDGGGGSNFVDDIALLNIGQWYTIMLDIDTSTPLANGYGSFDIYLDGSLIYSDAGFRHGYVGAEGGLDVFVLMAASGANQGNVMVDNVNMTPEPMTIALLGLGGLAVFRRRK
jgi:hypothetical protein